MVVLLESVQLIFEILIQQVLLCNLVLKSQTRLLVLLGSTQHLLHVVLRQDLQLFLLSLDLLFVSLVFLLQLRLLLLAQLLQVVVVLLSLPLREMKINIKYQHRRQ